MEKTLKWLQHSVSPIFLSLLVASFMLWYIAKLNYTYTTEQTVTVHLDEQEFEVDCVVEGLGTNLFKYQVYLNKKLNLPVEKLKYYVIDPDMMQEDPRYEHLPTDQTWIEIDPQMIREAISVQCSDIKILSAEAPVIALPKKCHPQQ